MTLSHIHIFGPDSGYSVLVPGLSARQTIAREQFKITAALYLFFIRPCNPGMYKNVPLSDKTVKVIKWRIWRISRFKSMFCHYAFLPWSHWFFVKFFFAKERVSREAAITRLVIAAWGSVSRKREEKFQGKPLGPGYTLYWSSNLVGEVKANSLYFKLKH